MKLAPDSRLRVSPPRSEAARSTGSTLQKLRAFCLSLPETTETSSWGHPNFRAGKRTFAAFERVGGRPSVAFRVRPNEAARVMRGAAFFATPYGRGLWVSLWADRPIDWEGVRRLLLRSYRGVALKRMLVAVDQGPAGPRGET
jgi:predicted DNA-binding protein (MmcQ/YjbR family)